MTAVFAARFGRVAFFVHEPSTKVPVAVRRWVDHQHRVLAMLPRGVPADLGFGDWLSGDPWVFWRLLSGNNREIGRGVGVYGSLERARAAAEQVVARAGEIEEVLAFDRHTSHAWCLALDGVAVIVAPIWHRSRRSNRLNLLTVRATLGSAEVNELATHIVRSGRSSAELEP